MSADSIKLRRESQSHGFTIEDLILKGMRGGVDALSGDTFAQSYTHRFDATSFLDPSGQGHRTSIKSTKYRPNGKTLIYLSDAKSIVQYSGMSESEVPRLIVAIYKQSGNTKKVFEIRDYLLTPEEWGELCGHVSPATIKEYENSFKMSAAPDPGDARKIAKQGKARLARDYASAIKWNYKIDSRRQRRLQCSVGIKDLEAVIEDKSRIKVYCSFDDLIVPRPGYLFPVSGKVLGLGDDMPIEISSPPRKRRKKRSGHKKSSSTKSPKKPRVR